MAIDLCCSCNEILEILQRVASSNNTNKDIDITDRIAQFILVWLQLDIAQVSKLQQLTQGQLLLILKLVSSSAYSQAANKVKLCLLKHQKKVNYHAFNVNNNNNKKIK
mgnify:CR=1 FL=1